jgi:hypothetical protein
MACSIGVVPQRATPLTPGSRGEAETSIGRGFFDVKVKLCVTAWYNSSTSFFASGKSRTDGMNMK